MPIVACRICKIMFSVKPSHQKLGWGIYCSRNCRDLGNRKGKVVLCHTCNKQIWRAPRYLNRSKSGYFFCSKKCSLHWKNSTIFVGKQHPLWKGGKASYRKRKMDNSLEPRCVKCDIGDTRVLVVHHIDRNRQNNELKNLMWLCRNCHYLEHDGKTF